MLRMLHAVCRTAAVVMGSIIAWAPPAQGQSCAPFTDVPASSGFCGNIQWLYNRGITEGCTATLYCPANLVRRDQMAAFMNRLADSLFPLNCGTGQVMKWNGATWACASDATGQANAFVQGGNAFGMPAVLGTLDAQPLDIEVGDSRAMRYEPNAISPNVIGGSPANNVTGGVRGATIGGGGVFPGTDTFFINEGPNRVTDAYGTVGGGFANRAGNDAGGGLDAGFATVAGGFGNTASGPVSTIAGGSNNVASGIHSFAAGRGANAQFDGCHVWSDDSSTGLTSCTAPNQFAARALGGFFFYTSGNSDVSYTGAALLAGTGAWTSWSDRNGKRDFEPVDPLEVLAKVVALPISTWQWKAEAGSVRHMGPTAQDFRAAFGLGRRETEIVTVDADGVALAAIQGLNAKLQAEVAALRAELAELRALVVERHAMGSR